MQHILLIYKFLFLPPLTAFFLFFPTLICLFPHRMTGEKPDTVQIKENELKVLKVDNSVNTTFVCEVKNSIGTTREQITINVRGELHPDLSKLHFSLPHTISAWIFLVWFKMWAPHVCIRHWKWLIEVSFSCTSLLRNELASQIHSSAALNRLKAVLGVICTSCKCPYMLINCTYLTHQYSFENSSRVKAKCTAGCSFIT